jgi:hypothetical protein
VREDQQRLEILIPPARSAEGLLMAVAGMVAQGWITYQLCNIILAIPRDHGLSWGSVLLAGLLAAMVFFGFEVTYGLLFEAFGTERLIISGQLVTVSRAVGRLGSSETYMLSDVSDLRVLEDPPTIRGIHFGRSLNGRLAFTVGTKTRRFGDFLELREAVKLAEMLSARGVR